MQRHTFRFGSPVKKSTLPELGGGSVESPHAERLGSPGDHPSATTHKMREPIAHVERAYPQVTSQPHASRENIPRSYKL
eukprot:7557360-Pyramimonas_sp.AAC.1